MESSPGPGSSQDENEDAVVDNECDTELKSINTDSTSEDRDAIELKAVYQSIFGSEISADSEVESDIFSSFHEADKINFLSNLPKISSLKNTDVQKEEEFASGDGIVLEGNSPVKETNVIKDAAEHLSPEEKETFSKLAEDLDLLNTLGASLANNGEKAVQLYMGPYGRIKSPFKKFSSFQNCSRSVKRSPRKLAFPKRKRLKFHHGGDAFTSDEEEEEEEEEEDNDDGVEDVLALEKPVLPSTSGQTQGATVEAPASQISPHSSEQTDDSSDDDKWEIIEDSENEFDEELNKKSNKFALSAVNVKSIIHKIVTNESVVEMVRQVVQEQTHAEQQSGFEPKMTRARVKEAFETHGNVPWGLSPVKKQKLDSKFVDIDLPEEEEDDEEYCPDKFQTSHDSDTEDTESVVSSSFTSDFGSPLPSTPSTPSAKPASFVCKSQTPSQSDSENNQSFLSPMGPPSNICIPKSNQKSSLLGRKFREAIERDELREAEEEELIASRTRSKRPLTDQSIQDIEANYMAPDITADMYDTECDDNEWQDFLTGFYKSAVASVEDIVDTIAEEEDPEYNFLEELEDEYDHEDFRDDRAVKVSKKELNELMDELYEEEYGISDPIDDTCKLSIKVQAEKIMGTNHVKKHSSHYKSLSSAISDYERRQIDDQMRKHVQLLTQTFVMAQDGVEEHKKMAAVARMYLNELNAFHMRFTEVGVQSAYDVYNLPSALAILDDPIWSKPQERPSSKVKDIVFRFDKQMVPRLSERQMDALWYNPTFMYPELLPQGGFFTVSKLKKDRARIKFTEAEDNLLAMGMEQFMHLRDGKEYICRYMLPCKTKKQVQGRIKNLSAKAASDNAVKMWKQHRCLPLFPQFALWFDASMMVAACDQDVVLENLPQWCTVYKKADEEEEASPESRQSVSAPVTPQGQKETLKGNEMSESFPNVKRKRVRKSLRRQLYRNGPFSSRPNNGGLGKTPQKPITVCVLNQITSTPDTMSYSVNQSCLEQTSAAAIPTTVSGPTVIVINNMPAPEVCNNKLDSTASYGVNALSQPLQGSVEHPQILSEALIDNSLGMLSQNSLGCSSVPIQCEDSLPEVPSATSLSDILSTAAVACNILPDIPEEHNASAVSMTATGDEVSVGTGYQLASGYQPMEQQPAAADTMNNQNNSFLQMLNDDNFMMTQTNTVSNEISQGDKNISNVAIADGSETVCQQSNVNDRVECSNEQLKSEDVKPVIVTIQGGVQTVVSSTNDNIPNVQPAVGLIPPSTLKPNLPQLVIPAVSQNSVVSGNQQPNVSVITLSSIHTTKTQTENNIVSCVSTPGEKMAGQLTQSQTATPPRVNIPEQGASGYTTPTQLTPSSSVSSQKSATKSALEIVASYAPYFISQTSSVRIYSAEQRRQERSPSKTMSRFIRLAPKGTPPSSEKPTGFIKVRSSPRKKQYQKQVKTILPKGFVISTFDKSPTKRVASSLVEKAKKGKHGFSRSRDKYCKILPAKTDKNLEVTGATYKTSNHSNENLVKPELSDTVKSSNKPVYECNQDGDGDRDLTEDDDDDEEEEDEDRDRDDDDDDKCFDTESDFTQSEDGNETQEEVDSQEDSQEDDDNHIADLMQASTTLRFDPGRDDLSKSRLGKKDRDRDTNLAMLAPDVIETDPQRDLRDTAFAQAYLHKVKKILRNDTDTFEQFLKTMYNFNQAGESPIKLYRDLEGLLAGHPDLLLDFAGFLLPEQAIECDCYSAFQEFSQARGFLRKLEIYFLKNPQHFQKVMKVFSRWYRKAGRKVHDLRDQVEPLLKGNRVLLDEFAKFFPCEPPPDSWMDDFEEVNLEEMGDDEKDNSFEEVELPDGEEILGTKHCTCVCHDTGDDNYRKKKKHCYRCCLTVIDGELVYKINKSTIKKIQVSFGPPIKPGHVPCEETPDAFTEAEIKVEPDWAEEPMEVTNESDWLLDTESAESDWLLDTEGAEKENIEHYSEGSSQSEESRPKNSKSGQKKGDKDTLKNSGFLQRISKLSRPTKNPARLSTMLKSPRERTPSDLCRSESRDKLECSDIKDCDASSSEMVEDKDIDVSLEPGTNRPDADGASVTPSEGDVLVFAAALAADEPGEVKRVDQTEQSPVVSVTSSLDQSSPHSSQTRASVSPDMEQNQMDISQFVNMKTSSDTSSAVQHSNNSADKVVCHAADASKVSISTESPGSSIPTEVLPFGISLPENSTDSSSVSPAPLISVQQSENKVSENRKTINNSEKKTIESSEKFTFGPLVPKPCVNKHIAGISAPEGQSHLPVSSGSCFFKIDKAAATTPEVMETGEVDTAGDVEKKDDKIDTNVVSPFSPFGLEIQNITACQSPFATVTSPGVCDHGKPVVKVVRRITPIPVKEQSLTSFQTLMENSPMISEDMVQSSPVTVMEKTSSGQGGMQTSGVVKPSEPSRTPTPISGDTSLGTIPISTKRVETSPISQNSGGTLKSGSHNSDSNTSPGIKITQPNLFSENANESFSKSPGKGSFLSEESMFKCFEKPPEFGDHLASISNLTNILDGLGGKLYNSKSEEDRSHQSSNDVVEQEKCSTDSLKEDKHNKERQLKLDSLKEADDKIRLDKQAVSEDGMGICITSETVNEEDKGGKNDETKMDLVKEQSGDNTENSEKHHQGFLKVSKVSDIEPICQTPPSNTLTQTTDERSSICLFTPLRKVLDNGTVILTSGSISRTDVSICSEVSKSGSQKVVETKQCQETDEIVAGTTDKLTDETKNKEDSHSCKKHKKSKSRHKHSKKSRHSKDGSATAIDVSKPHGSGMESDASSRKSRHKSKHKSKHKKHLKESGGKSGETDWKQNPVIAQLASNLEGEEASEIYSDVVSESIESGEVSRQSFSSQTDANEEEIHVNIKDGLAVPVKHELTIDDESGQIISKSINVGEKEICKLKPRELNLKKSTVEVNRDVTAKFTVDSAIETSGHLETEADIKMEPNDSQSEDENQQKPTNSELCSEIMRVYAIKEESTESHEGICSKQKKKSKHKGKDDDERKKRKKQKRKKDKNESSADDKAECSKNADEEMDRRKSVESPISDTAADQDEPDRNLKMHAVVGRGPQAVDPGQSVVAEAMDAGDSTSPLPQQIPANPADHGSSTEDSSTESMMEDEPHWSKDTDRIILETCKTMGVKEKTFQRIAKQLGHVTSKQVRKRFSELIQFIFGSSASAATSQQ